MPCNLERTIIDNLVICYLAPTELLGWLKVENSLLYDQSYLEVIDQLSVRWKLEFNGFTSLDLARDFGYDEIENASPG